MGEGHKVFPLFEEYSLEYRKSIVGIEEKWDCYTSQDIFLRSKYLSTLESVPPSGMQFRYVCIMKDNKAIGVLYFQIIKRSLSDSLQNSGFVKRSLASMFQTYIMICGNSLVTGSYGYHFLDQLDSALVFKLIDHSTEVVRKELKKEGIRVGAHLKKDYKASEIPVSGDLNGYTLFQVQPNMEMEIKDEWNLMEDYSRSLKSKSRVRMRRAKKKSENLVRQELDIESLGRLKEVMYQQYLQTVEGAGFNLFYLHTDYNIALKNSFDSEFKVFGYFDQQTQKLLGYYTLIKNVDHLEAHFLGYEHKENAKYQTYLNFLYDMIERGIAGGFKSINMSRTAMEIKSSVGADAFPLKVFMKYNNGVINKMLPKALAYFVPKDEWTPRSPFKKKQA